MIFVVDGRNICDRGLSRVGVRGWRYDSGIIFEYWMYFRCKYCKIVVFVRVL